MTKAARNTAKATVKQDDTVHQAPKPKPKPAPEPEQKRTVPTTPAPAPENTVITDPEPALAPEPESATSAATEQTEVPEPVTSASAWLVSGQHWQACYEAVTGLAHRDANPPLPCQDSSLGLATPRPAVIVADGAGSSAVSELGAQAVTIGLARLLNTLEKQLAELLDKESQEDKLRPFGLLLVKHAKGILDDLAAQHRRPQKDFRCTLLLLVQGKERLLWVKVGDGALVTERLTLKQDTLHPELVALGELGKGEFANHTTFIDDHLQPDSVQTGTCASAYITGFAAMSDGAADRLVSNDGKRVSDQISDWLHELRQGKLKRRALTRLFSSEQFTRGTSGDDASIALCASSIMPAAEHKA